MAVIVLMVRLQHSTRTEADLCSAYLYCRTLLWVMSDTTWFASSVDECMLLPLCRPPNKS